jgi:agmatine deiminase
MLIVIAIINILNQNRGIIKLENQIKRITPIRPLVLGLVQMAMSEDMDINLNNALEYCSQLATNGAELIILPELFRSPYFCVTEKCEANYSDPLDGVVFQSFSKLAKEKKVVIVAGSIFEDGKYNTSMVFDTDGSLAGYYRKSHIPNDPGFYEKSYFTPGDTGFKVFTTSKLKFSVLICFDQWFPEAARVAALNGAELLVYPTAIGNVDGVGQPEGNWREAWETVQRAHGIANCIPVASVNRVGTEGTSHFWGNSFVSDAFGYVITKAGQGVELLLTTIDLDHGPMIQREWLFKTSRRVDLYGKIVE